MSLKPEVEARTAAYKSGDLLSVHHAISERVGFELVRFIRRVGALEVMVSAGEHATFTIRAGYVNLAKENRK